MKKRSFHGTVTLFSFLLLQLLSNVSQGYDENEVARAEQYMLEHSARSSNPSVNRFASMRAKWSSTADSEISYECNCLVEYLEMDKGKFIWKRTQKSSDWAGDERRSDMQQNCNSEIACLNGRWFVPMPKRGDIWIALSQKDRKDSAPATNCDFPSVFSVPFIYRQALVDSRAVFEFNKRTCYSAEKTDDCLSTLWAKDGGKGMSITHVKFKDSLPVLFEIAILPMQVGTQKPTMQQGHRIASVKTKWESKGRNTFPIEVVAVFKEANETIEFDAQIDWKLGDDIPSSVAQQALVIKAELGAIP